MIPGWHSHGLLSALFWSGSRVLCPKLAAAMASDSHGGNVVADGEPAQSVVAAIADKFVGETVIISSRLKETIAKDMQSLILCVADAVIQQHWFQWMQFSRSKRGNFKRCRMPCLRGCCGFLKRSNPQVCCKKCQWSDEFTVVKSEGSK